MTLGVCFLFLDIPSHVYNPEKSLEEPLDFFLSLVAQETECYGMVLTIKKKLKHFELRRIVGNDLFAFCPANENADFYN